MIVRALASFSAFAAMIVFAIGYIGSLDVRVGLPAHRTDLSMDVADVNGLVVGSNVLLRGVPVGKVSRIETSVDAARVGFYIGGQFEVPVDTDVRLENLSALGESYISMSPRSRGGPILRQGQHLAMESITAPPSISDLATSVVRVLNQLDPIALERIVGEADAALPDANSVLPNLARTSRLLRNTAADMQGRGQELIANFQMLLQNAGWLGPVLADLTAQLYGYNPHLRDLFATFPPLIAVGAPEPLYKFDALLGRVQRLLDNHGGDLKVIGDRFQPHLTAIGGSLLNFDTGQVFANMLASVPEEGVIPLHISLAGN